MIDSFTHIDSMKILEKEVYQLMRLLIDGNSNIDHFFFLSTPTVFPLLPVVLVCCPLTLSPHLCLRPLLLLILKSLSTSSLSFVSRMLEAT